VSLEAGSGFGDGLLDRAAVRFDLLVPPDLVPAQRLAHRMCNGLQRAQAMLTIFVQNGRSAGQEVLEGQGHLILDAMPDFGEDIGQARHNRFGQLRGIFQGLLEGLSVRAVSLTET